MNYRKVMTKLSENNVTYVIQTMSSMNYFVIGTAKSFGIHKAALIYKITVNALLESK
jgi:hypothetical protein